MEAPTNKEWESILFGSAVTQRVFLFACGPRIEVQWGAAELVQWQVELVKRWSALRFGPATVEQQGEQYLFHVQVFLDDVDPDAVRVELYADALKDGEPITHADDSWRTASRSDECFHPQCFCSDKSPSC